MQYIAVKEKQREGYSLVPSPTPSFSSLLECIRTLCAKQLGRKCIEPTKGYQSQSMIEESVKAYCAKLRVKGMEEKWKEKHPNNEWRSWKLNSKRSDEVETLKAGWRMKQAGKTRVKKPVLEQGDH